MSCSRAERSITQTVQVNEDTACRWSFLGLTLRLLRARGEPAVNVTQTDLHRQSASDDIGVWACCVTGFDSWLLASG